jgi:hypothetical protein
MQDYIFLALSASSALFKVDLQLVAARTSLKDRNARRAGRCPHRACTDLTSAWLG